MTYVRNRWHTQVRVWGGGSPTPPFDPSQIPGLQLWLDSSMGVSTTGSKVTAWADQSGQGNDAVAATSLLQPTLTLNQINGLPTVDFDGVANGMLINGVGFMNLDPAAPSPYTGNDGFEWVFVYKLRSLNPGMLFSALMQTFNSGDVAVPNSIVYNWFADLAIDPTRHNLEILNAGTGSPSSEFAAGTNSVVQADGNFHSLFQNFDGATDPLTPGNVTFIQDGNSFSGTALSDTGGVAALTATWLGCNNQVNNNADMQLAAVYLYNRKLMSSERSQLTSYINTRFGL